MALYFLAQRTTNTKKVVMKFETASLVYRFHSDNITDSKLPRTTTMYRRVAELGNHYFIFRRISFKEYKQFYSSLPLIEQEHQHHFYLGA